MGEDLFETMHRQMVAEIAVEANLTASHTGRASFDERVMEVMGKVRRHEFVPVELKAYGYLNTPLPVGFGKTISQPFIVALMTDLLAPSPDDVVLEIGAGVGYQAAILAELARQVYSVEIIEELAQGAEKRLQRLGYHNVEIRVANGYYGWPQHAPYDKVIVTAAPDLIPAPLINQLKPGGRMVIPTGIPDKQQLVLVEKAAGGGITTRDILPVRFSELEESGDFAGAA